MQLVDIEVRIVGPKTGKATRLAGQLMPRSISSRKRQMLGAVGHSGQLGPVALRPHLVVAAIILRNTVYLERATVALRAAGHDLPDDKLAHVALLSWEHINLTGDYARRVTVHKMTNR